MTQFKGTPGPWHIGMKPGPIIYGPNGEQVIDMRSPMLPEDEHKANVSAIAAVPELIEALQDALIAFQLLGSGQEPPLSNAEYCELIGAVLSGALGND